MALHSSKQINHKIGGEKKQNIPRKNKLQIISTNLVLNAAQDTNCFKSRQRQLNAHLVDAERGWLLPWVSSLTNNSFFALNFLLNWKLTASHIVIGAPAAVLDFCAPFLLGKTALHFLQQLIIPGSSFHCAAALMIQAGWSVIKWQANDTVCNVWVIGLNKWNHRLAFPIIHFTNSSNVPHSR